MKALVIISVVIAAALIYRLVSSLKTHRGSLLTSKVKIEDPNTLEQALNRYKDLDD